MGRCVKYGLWALVLIIGLSFFYPPSMAATRDRVNIAVKQEPLHFDVSFDSGGETALVLENINEFLIKKKPSGEHIPGLASSWTISSDGKTIEFEIRKGVKFHSGDLLTADDVKFSFDRALAKNRWMKIKLRNMDRIEVVDDYRIRFLFKKPDVTFLRDRAATMIVSKRYYDRAGEDKFKTEPVGTGPYKIVRHESGQYVDIERFDDYWGKKPPVKTARIYFVSEDSTRMAKLEAGEVDLIQGVPFSAVKEMDDSPKLKTVRMETNSPPRAVVFTNRNQTKPFYDKRVRMAMAYAIDVDSIISKLFFGVPHRLQLLMPEDLGYDSAIRPYPYDPEKAKKLLAEAGYPNGLEFNLYWQMGGRVAMNSELAQTIAAYFEAVGIRTQIQGQERAAFMATRGNAKKPTSDYVAISAGALTGGTEPTMNADLYFSCKGPASPYCNPEFDKVLDDARTTMDDNQRADLIKKMTKILYDDVAAIPIFANVAVYGMKKNIDFIPTRYFFDLMLVKDITVN